MDPHLYSSVITEPQNGSGWKRPLEVIWSKPLLKQGYLQPLAKGGNFIIPLGNPSSSHSPPE